VIIFTFIIGSLDLLNLINFKFIENTLKNYVSMAKVVLEIHNCGGCPHKVEKNLYSSDGWDRIIDWFCSKTEPHTKIQGAVEWHEEKHIVIPDWCPILIKEQT
jgi:hypothetical protein